jgi:hypothetical protein
MSTVIEPTQAEERWLECKLDKGMFSDEIAVTYPPEGNTQKSVFVESTAVRGTPGNRGRVLVRVIRRNGNTIAVLPSPNQDIVYVQAGDISGE